MKVDRTKFLLLTGALSAATAVGVATQSGCTVTSGATDGGTVSPTPPPSGDDTTDGGDAGDDGGACYGDSVTEGGDASTYDCSQSACATDCTNVQNAYKAGVAQAAVQCILALPTCESGSSELTQCATDALAKACADTSADTLCAKLVAGCNGADAGDDAGYDAGATDAGTTTTTPFDQANCVTLVRGLDDAARTSFVTCVTEGAGADSGVCKTDPGTCIDSFIP